ncbi:putative mediator of RNA polymerase II transcription subunit 12 isoform X3 [Drosophila grimshawi]|uniref:putative mediator of RNA polymerase II transcription subunit 12 isoform X3 n=1 Tax=Drosophila grimshawi TaxID=7222 RepID=UPI000C86E971|nr:putative mediator of RNA polymerase II transcription subunit 12 isoform X3 [Drosophila grimshawi]
MVIDIKMCRFDNVPWGFRLVGGADYEYPLTVVKVAEGSIAEEAGLCVEDVIVRINDTAAMPLTHDEAHSLILSSGSVFYFGVYREHEEQLDEEPKRFPLRVGSLTKSATASPERSATASASASPLPSLTEVTKALIPEQEQVVVAQLEELECRSAAVTEMHSHANDTEQGLAKEEQNANANATATATATANANAIENEDNTQYLPELPDRPCSAMSERSDMKLVEEEIAAVLSGESEVLKEHNVLGIFPKPGVCMTSDVLRSLNEEVTKTKLEKEKENRKWSTFLQRPDRPVPKSKQQLEAEQRAANAYKVKIVKSMPRDKSPLPEATPKEVTPPPKEPTPPTSEESEKQPQEEKEVEEEPLPTDSEVPNLEQLPDNDKINSNNNELPEDAEGEQLEKADASKEEQEEERQQLTELKAQREAEEEAEQQTGAASAAEPNEAAEPVAEKTDEELALEKQLADVQKQLAALSSLPSTIQSTLDAVTKQLAELLPTFKLQQKEDLPQIDEQLEKEQELEQQQQGEYEDTSDSAEKQQQQQQQPDEVGAACENNEDKCDGNDLQVPEISLSNGDNRQREQSGGGQPNVPNEEQCFKKQKKHNVIEELEEHLVRKNNPRRSKRAFGPLTPSSERPLVLPGGRRWYRPKDAYNDEFIAETLSAQAELITGSTLGVNFMKYQKPERKLDYNRSEVYKVIHHLDRAPIRGIEVRAPLVAAESDIRQSLQSS